MKFKVRNWICLILVVVISSLFPFIPTLKSKIDSQDNKNYKAIIEIWQIDTFEGGINSRGGFLKKVALNFSKKYNDVLCLVSVHSTQSAVNLMNNGRYPDVISFGCGKIELFNKAINLKGYNVNDAGVLDNKRYMIAWCRGGYFEIKRKAETKIEKVILSAGEFNLPSVAKSFSSYSDYEEISLPNLDAYTCFLNNKNSALIGTQRDIFRLQSRGVDFEAKPISEFSDLYQYLSIIDKGKEKNFYSTLFLSELLSEKVQMDLVNIGMLSVKYNNLYLDNEFMHALEKTNPNYTISPYISFDRLNDIKNQVNIINNNNEIIKLLKHL